jgi:hypothetical protein
MYDAGKLFLANRFVIPRKVGQVVMFNALPDHLKRRGRDGGRRDRRHSGFTPEPEHCEQSVFETHRASLSRSRGWVTALADYTQAGYGVSLVVVMCCVVKEV